MTRGATSQNLGLLNLVFTEQRFAFSQLVAGSVLLSPLHVKNLVRRSDEFLGVPMTAKTPFHLQRRGLIRNRHLIDATMAGRATDTFIHVNAVVEI